MSRDDFKLESARAVQDGFNAFLQQPMTKMGISLLPPHPEHTELLEQLLRSAYEAGFNTGQANMAVQMIESLVNKKR